MFIEVATQDGGVHSIAVKAIIRFRPSFGASEPGDSTKIEHGDETFFTPDTLVAVKQKIGAGLRLAELTTPNELPVVVDAEKVSGIGDPVPSQHHENAGAVLRIAGRDQQVRESQDAARQIIEAALGAGL